MVWNKENVFVFGGLSKLIMSNTLDLGECIYTSKTSINLSFSFSLKTVKLVLNVHFLFAYRCFKQSKELVFVVDGNARNPPVETVYSFSDPSEALSQ